jgi:hypothetical protein
MIGTLAMETAQPSPEMRPLMPGRYQLYRLDADDRFTKVVEVEGDSDGAAIADALRHTWNGASFVFCEGERQIAVIEVNDNRCLFANREQPKEQARPLFRWGELPFLAALASGILRAVGG